MTPLPPPSAAPIPLTAAQLTYTEIHQLLAKAKAEDDPRALAAAVSIMLGDAAFAKWIASMPAAPKPIADAAACHWVANKYLYRLLYARDYAGAALLLWGPEVFDPRPRSCRLIFDALHNHALVNAMGGASSSKTYSGVAWMLLDYALDPEWTTLLLVGPTADHLKQNAFGDLIRLHGSAVIPLPGKADTESLSVDKRVGMGFFTVALDRGPAASAKLKGYKTKARTTLSDHPLFGRSSRLRILIDEAQQVPINAWAMLLNAISNKESEEHLKVYCAANPSDEYSAYGKNCKPIGGWADLGKLTESWISETGWAVVRLNAMLSENVMARKVIFPRLISYPKVQSIIRGAGGDEEAPEVYTQVYGMFPPHGASASVIQKRHVEESRGEWIFNRTVAQYLSNDPAYTGDRPATAIARFGEASAWRDFNGQVHALPGPVQAIQIDSVGQLTRGDFQDMADEIFALARQLNLRPDSFVIDRTGLGQGLHDIVRRQWRSKVNRQTTDAAADILGVHYSESASDVTIVQEDGAVPSQLYDNVATEMWYAAAKFFELGIIRLGRGVDLAAIEELVSRRGGRSSTKAKRQVLESKDAYKARGNKSPDFADAIMLVIHCIRMREDFTPKFAATEPEPETREEPIRLVDMPGFVKEEGAAPDITQKAHWTEDAPQLSHGFVIDIGAGLDQRD